MNKKWILVLSGLVLLSCKTNQQIIGIQPQKNFSMAENLPEDEAMKNIIAPYKKELEDKMSSKISYTSVDLNKQGDNSNLGNLLSDYTYDAALAWGKQNGIPNVDGAIINIGGIRSTIGKGDILLKHIFEVMPFENELVIVKLKGDDLEDVFEYYLKEQKNNPVTGFNIETEGGKLTKALVGGKKVNEDQYYYIATSDYLSLGGDNMWFFEDGEVIKTGLKLRDVYVEEFRKHPNIVAPSDVRLIFNGKSK